MRVQKSRYEKLLIFLLLTFSLSSIVWYLAIATESLYAWGALGPAALMWCPGIAAIITQCAYTGSAGGLGWRWGKTRYQVYSYLTPILYASVAYGIVWSVDLGERGNAFSRPLVHFLIIGTLYDCLLALGEEIGWRGFLVPELAKLTNFTNVSLISGVIWAVWHYPVLLFAGYYSGDNPIYALFCFTVMVIGISFVFAWFRLKSGSVYTAMFLHGAHNLYIQDYFDRVTIETGMQSYITGEFGAALAIIGVVMAFVAWKFRYLLPRPAA